MATISQWALLGVEPDLTSGAPVTLRSLSVNRSLRFGERENGIELVWDRASDLGNVTVFRQVGGGPIAFATPIAIQIDNGGFLHYAERTTGINLVWSPTPSFEWEITGGIPGTPIPLNGAVALLNTLHGDHLIYDSRPRGINLRWYADLALTNPSPGPNQPGGNDIVFARYPPLPIPNQLRAPAREAAQIQVSGEARRVTLFHGRVDDELDWHLYIAFDPADRHALATHVHDHARGGSHVTDQDLDEISCELMVLDAWQNPIFDEFFFSADVTRTFALTLPAWDASVQAGNNQGGSVDFSGRSRLTQSAARVLMQGPFLNDRAHGFHMEIHPLDSIAYALAVDRKPIAFTADDPRWPKSDLIWRVAAFTNSTFHRIHAANYLNQERAVTWLLELPRADRAMPGPHTEPGLHHVRVTKSEPPFTNRAFGAQDFDDTRPTATPRYTRHGVISEQHSVTERDANGRRFLQVDIRLGEADRWGGMFLADYAIQAGPIAAPPGDD